jgi:hypothetical protein
MVALSSGRPDDHPKPVGPDASVSAEAPESVASGRDGGGRSRISGWLRQAWPPLLILAWGAVVVTLVLLDVPAAVRGVPVLAYLAVAPGLAYVRLLRLSDGVKDLLLGVGLSLALGVVVAQGMIYLHLWSPLLGLSTLAALASLAALFELLRGPLATWLGRFVKRRSS